MSEATRSLKKILRIKRLKDKLDMSTASIYNKLNPRSKYYDPTFPKPIKLSSSSTGTGGAVGWLEAEVDQWLELRADASRV